MEMVKTEIEDLHAGVVDWINGTCERSGEMFDNIYAGRLDKGFALVAPTGHRLSRDMVTQYIEGVHGTNPDFRIQISDVRVVSETDEMLVAHCLMWHKNANQSANSNLGRNLSAVFAKDSAMPNGLRWVFAHESALPQEEMEAKEYSF